MAKEDTVKEYLNGPQEQDMKATMKIISDKAKEH